MKVDDLLAYRRVLGLTLDELVLGEGSDAQELAAQRARILADERRQELEASAEFHRNQLDALEVEREELTTWLGLFDGLRAASDKLGGIESANAVKQLEELGRKSRELSAKFERLGRGRPRAEREG